MAASTTTRRSARPSRAPRTRPADRRRQLLDVAEQLIESGGSDALRMDTLAQAAGVSRPVVYEHFENRDGLIVALLERHEERVNRDELPESPGHSFENVLASATRAYLETSIEHGPSMRALISGEHLSPAVESVRQRIWDAGVSKWARLYREHFTLGQQEATMLALSHLTGLSSLAGGCIAGRFSIRRACDVHVRSVLGSLAAISGAGHGRSS